MPEWLRRRAETTPGRAALITEDRQYSFAELDALVSQTARRLGSLGLREGDRVALLLRNGAAFVEMVHGVSRLGAIVVPLNTRLTGAEIAWQLADVDARLLVYDAANAQVAEAVGGRLPELTCADVRRVGVASGAAGAEADIPLQDRVDLSAVHSILYTSGTTGRPKGAMLTYGNLWWSAVGSVLNLGNHENDRWLACLPLFHVAGLSILTRSVIYGITAVVHESFDPAAVNRAIDEGGVTIVSVVSNMLARMLDARGEVPYPRTLRCVLLGGGPAPLPLLERCARLGVPVVQTYGLTETTSQVATLPPEDAVRKLGSAGKPLFPTELRIEKARGEAPATVEAPVAGAGEVGEILVRGPSVTPGYFGRPKETADALRGGWLHTGDLGYFDAEGYLYVLDRRDDLILSGGENVYPAEVEAVLAAHPGVEEAGVTGIQDDRWGQVAVAIVKVRQGGTVDEEALLAFCRERLASYKVPVRIQFIDALPRNASGKLLRRSLREMWRDDDGQ